MDGPGSKMKEGRLYWLPEGLGNLVCSAQHDRKG